jgi:glycosyltransferase involved in cell wall biosynthesis
MINVLFVSHSSELNGAERMLLDVLRTCDRKKFQPFLIVPHPGDLVREAEAIGVETVVRSMKWNLTEKSKIWKQPLSRAWNVPVVLAIERFIKNRGISLVVTNSAACWAGALAARRARIPHVWFIHEILDGDAPLLYGLFGRKAIAGGILKLSRRVVVNSLASARTFGGSAKVVVVGNGIAPAAEASVPPPSAVKASFGWGEAARITAVVGKIYPGKGQRDALLAFEILRRSFPNVKLLVVGGVEDKRYADGLVETVRTHGLENDVRFTGVRDDLPAILGALDVLFVPSTVDSLGRAALEAMASGVPVVAAARGGLSEVVIDGETGILADPPGAEGLAAGASRLFTDPELVRRITAGGRRLVALSYSLEGQTKKIEHVLEESFEL